MSLNWKEIDLVLEELDLPGFHIQDIRQPDYQTLVLSLYRPGRTIEVLVSLGSGSCRLHATTRKRPQELPPQRFVQILRKHIRNGRILEARQLGGERIVRILVQRSGDIRILWIRLWSGQANVILTNEDNGILDAFYRKPKKGETSGGVFAVPEATEGDPKYGLREREIGKSYNETIDELYREKTDRVSEEELVKQALALIEKRRVRILSSLETLKKKLADYQNPERFKELGDLVTANLHLYRKGMKEILLEDFTTGNQVIIPLDPTKSGPENAWGFYEKHKKAKAGLGILQDELTNLETSLSRLEEEALAIPEMGLKRLETLVTKERTSKKQASSDQVGLRFESGPFTILVGRTASENDELLRHHVKPRDMWLHARDYPGAYVFVKSRSGKTVPLDTLLDAGNLALFYSKGRSSGSGDIYYTEVRYLRRAKNGPKGLVLPTQEKNLSIALDDERIARMGQAISGR